MKGKRVHFHLGRAWIISIIITVLAVISFPGSSPAQNKFGIDFGIATGKPTGDFSNFVDNSALGGFFALHYRLRETPFMIGVNFRYMRYGKERRKELISADIPDLPVKITNTNDMIISSFFLRMQPKTGAVRPYVEGFAGFNYIFTSTSASGDWNTEYLNITNLSDYALVYGFGGGLKIKVFDSKMLKAKERIIVYLDMNSSYIFGGEAQYLKEGSIIRNGSSVFYDTDKSRTDMLLINFGLSFDFNIQ